MLLRFMMEDEILTYCWESKCEEIMTRTYILEEIAKKLENNIKMSTNKSSQKQKSSKTSQKTSDVFVYSYSVTTSSSASSDGTVTTEKHIEYVNKNGKVNGRYQEKKNGKVIKDKKLTTSNMKQLLQTN